MSQLAFPGLILGRTRTSGRNGANQYTHARAAQRQLARCEGILAQQHAAETPPFRRCTVCQGREDVTQPHQHGAAA